MIFFIAICPAFQTQAAMGGWYAAPELAADPQDTGVLVAAEPGMSPSSVASCPGFCVTFVTIGELSRTWHSQLVGLT
jgi:hypothetical protein